MTGSVTGLEKTAFLLCAACAGIDSRHGTVAPCVPHPFASRVPWMAGVANPAKPFDNSASSGEVLRNPLLNLAATEQWVARATGCSVGANTSDLFPEHLGPVPGTPRTCSRNTSDLFPEHLGPVPGTPRTCSRNTSDLFPGHLGPVPVTTHMVSREHLGPVLATPRTCSRN